MTPSESFASFRGGIRPREGWALLVFISALALLLRVATLAEPSLWADEFATLWFQAQPWSFLWSEVPRFETHPPLYYALLGAILPDEPDAFGLRLPGALAGVALVPVVYAIGRRCFGDPVLARRAALYGAIVAAIHPFLIDMQQMARMYSFVILFFAAQLLLVLEAYRRIFVRGAETPPQELPKLVLIGVAIGAVGVLAQLFQSASAFYTFGACLGLAVRAGVALFVERTPAARSAAVQAIIVLGVAVLIFAIGFAPFAPMLLLQTGSLSLTSWIEPPSLRSIAGLGAKFFGAPRLEDTTGAGIVLVAAGALAFAAASAAAWVDCMHSRRSALRSPDGDGAQFVWTSLIFLAAALTPLLLFLAVSAAGHHLLIPRTASPATVPIIGLIVMTFAVLRDRRNGRLAVGLAAAWLSLGAAIHVLAPHPYEDIRGVVSRMQSASANTTDATILAIPDFEQISMAYYAKRLGWNVNVVSPRGQYPVKLTAPHLPDLMNEPEAAARHHAARIAEAMMATDCAWLVIRGERRYDPGNFLIDRLKRHYGVGRLILGQAQGEISVYVLSRDGADCVSPGRRDQLATVE